VVCGVCVVCCVCGMLCVWCVVYVFIDGLSLQSIVTCSAIYMEVMENKNLEMESVLLSISDLPKRN
jgi:hypothetical protein